MTRTRLAGKVAVVTGASSGVGRAIARAFAAEGAKVGLMARNVDGLRAAADEIRELGSEALVLPLDVADAGAVNAAAGEVVARWGQLDGPSRAALRARQSAVEGRSRARSSPRSRPSLRTLVIHGIRVVEGMHA